MPTRIDALDRARRAIAHARGLWAALQAISRLAHAGCQAGDLEVTAVQRPAVLAAACAACRAAPRVADASSATCCWRWPPSHARKDAGAFRITTSASNSSGRSTSACSSTNRRRGDRVAHAHIDQRKATGSFYTPRAMTEFLVRRTLAPLVEGQVSRRDPRAARRSIRRWAAARSSSPPAAFSPTHASTR